MVGSLQPRGHNMQETIQATKETMGFRGNTPEQVVNRVAPARDSIVRIAQLHMQIANRPVAQCCYLIPNDAKVGVQ